MKVKLSLYVTAIVLVAILTVGVGCTKAPNDAQLTSDIQTKLASDSGLQSKQLGVKAEGGTVTLTGTVDNDAQREAAARYASSEPGVKQIINNLQVAAPGTGIFACGVLTYPSQRESEEHGGSHGGKTAKADGKTRYLGRTVTGLGVS